MPEYDVQVHKGHLIYAAATLADSNKRWHTEGIAFSTNFPETLRARVRRMTPCSRSWALTFSCSLRAKVVPVLECANGALQLIYKRFPSTRQCLVELVEEFGLPLP